MVVALLREHAGAGRYVRGEVGEVVRVWRMKRSFLALHVLSRPQVMTPAHDVPDH